MTDDGTQLSTHAEWTLLRAKRLREAIVNGSENIGQHYESLAHALLEARPDVLREVVEHVDITDCEGFEKLIAMAWRIVGNEFREDQTLVERSCRSILQVCDGVEEATDSFARHLWKRPDA